MEKMQEDLRKLQNSLEIAKSVKDKELINSLEEEISVIKKDLKENNEEFFQDGKELFEKVIGNIERKEKMKKKMIRFGAFRGKEFIPLNTISEMGDLIIDNFMNINMSKVYCCDTCEETYDKVIKEVKPFVKELSKKHSKKELSEITIKEISALFANFFIEMVKRSEFQEKN